MAAGAAGRPAWPANSLCNLEQIDGRLGQARTGQGFLIGTGRIVAHKAVNPSHIRKIDTVYRRIARRQGDDSVFRQVFVDDGFGVGCIV